MTTPHGPHVAVVIPTYNESDTIAEVVAAVVGHGYRLLVVDAGSPDGTGEIIDRLAATTPGLGAVHRPEKQGLGPAYGQGFSEILDSDDVQIVCQMDADLSHDPAALPSLVAAVVNGADAALGSRLVPGGGIVNWAWHRRLLSRWGNRYARFMLGLPVLDVTSGFRAYRVETLRSLDPATCRANGYAFQIEMTRRTHDLGATVAEVPITFTERRAGASKMSMRIVVEAMWLVTLWGLRRLIGRR